MGERINENFAPTDFYYLYEGTDIKESEVLSSGDPTYIDQLLLGYMRNPVEGSQEAEGFNFKRRSPLSFSAMTPIHPNLSAINKETATFDRREDGQANVFIRIKEKGSDKKKTTLSTEEARQLLKDKKREQLPASKYIPKQTRASGLFLTRIVIDMERLFSVNIDEFKTSEVSNELIGKMLSEGWEKGQNRTGEVLTLPSAKRELYIPAIAASLLNWRITSNQSRTYDPMTVLAVAISNSANDVERSIRTRINEETDRPELVLNKNIETNNTNLFVSEMIEGIMKGETGMDNALGVAEDYIIEYMREYKYPSQD